ATAVTVNDPLPALTGVTWTIESQTASACSITGAVGAQVLSCTIGDMASGATYMVHITSPTTTAGSLPNTATASSSNDGSVHALATIVVTTPPCTENCLPPPGLAIPQTSDATPAS